MIRTLLCTVRGGHDWRTFTNGTDVLVVCVSCPTRRVYPNPVRIPPRPVEERRPEPTETPS